MAPSTSKQFIFEMWSIRLNEQDKVYERIIEFPKVILFNPSWVKDFIISSSDEDRRKKTLYSFAFDLMWMYRVGQMKPLLCGDEIHNKRQKRSIRCQLDIRVVQIYTEIFFLSLSHGEIEKRLQQRFAQYAYQNDDAWLQKINETKGSAWWQQNTCVIEITEIFEWSAIKITAWYENDVNVCAWHANCTWRINTKWLNENTQANIHSRHHGNFHHFPNVCQTIDWVSKKKVFQSTCSTLVSITPMRFAPSPLLYEY